MAAMIASSCTKEGAEMSNPRNPLFVDISSWNGATPINWQAYKAWSAAGDGISRVLLRDDQGVGDPDSSFEIYWAGALAAGIDEIFVYHYAYPNLHPGAAGAVEEAQSMEQVIGHRLRPNDKVMLDLEQNEDSAWAIAFGEQMLSWHPTASKPVIYDSLAHIQQFLTDPQLALIFDLGLADWTFDPNSRPACPAPWPRYAWLQFTDRLAVPGMPGTVDANVFLGGVMIPQGPFYWVTVGQSPVPSGLTLNALSQQFGLPVDDLTAVIGVDPGYAPDLAIPDGTVIKLPGFALPANEPLADAAHQALKAWLGV